jgi:hypothetical protein
MKNGGGSQMQARLQGIGQTVNGRLDRLDGLFPEQKQAMPFQEYLARASVQAQADPDFGATLGKALRQYQAAQGALNGPNKR